MMRVLVAGAGAVGQWLGGRLHEGGHEVTLLTTARHAAALDAGLCVRGESSLCWFPDHAAHAKEAEGPFDAAVFTPKAHQTLALGRDVAAAGVLRPGGFVLSLQNGFANGAKLAASFPAASVAVGLTSHGVTLESPGHLLHAGTGPTLVGPASEASVEAAQRALALLKDARLDPEWHASMRAPVWRKAAVNHAVNPLAAAAGLTNGEVAADAGLLAHAKRLAAEAASVGQAAGVPGLDGLGDVVEQTLRRTAANKCSMLQDVLAHRRTEIEQISGRFVRLARAQGTAVPESGRAYVELKRLEAAYLGTPAPDEAAWDAAPF